MPASSNNSNPKKKTVRSRRAPRDKRVAGRLLIALAVVCVILLGLTIPVVAVTAPRDAVIRIPDGATRRNVADSLTKYFGEKFSKMTMRVLRADDKKLAARHGAYLIEKGTNPVMAQHRLMHSAQTPVRATVNGFRHLSTLAERMAVKFDFSADDFIKAATDPDILARYGLTPESALALFTDNTYEFYWSATPQEVVEKIGRTFSSLWNEERRRKAERLGITPAQAMIICSIADEETNMADEKGRIARLYLNRLKKGMRLQADPTVRYALNDFTIRRVLRQHLAVESPYNTYRVDGLPPGPIRTTSQATLDAFLSSPESDDLYMCASEDFSGHHNFAPDFVTHSRNAERYRKALDKRGIK